MNDILKKILEQKKKYYIQEMWDRFDYIGWGIKSKDHKSLRKKIREEFSEKDIKKMKSFSVYQRKKLAEVLTKYEKDNNLSNYYAVSDDGFWDLTAHIVGLGQLWYKRVLNDPEIAREISINRMYEENFEYIFCK